MFIEKFNHISGTVVEIDTEGENENVIPPRYPIIFGLFLLSQVWTLLLTFIPVFVTAKPNNLYHHYTDWYGVNDVIRLIEPIGGLPINFAILLESGVFQAVFPL